MHNKWNLHFCINHFSFNEFHGILSKSMKCRKCYLFRRVDSELRNDYNRSLEVFSLLSSEISNVNKLTREVFRASFNISHRDSIS